MQVVDVVVWFAVAWAYDVVDCPVEPVEFFPADGADRFKDCLGV